MFEEEKRGEREKRKEETNGKKMRGRSDMVDPADFLYCSLLCFLAHLLRVLKKYVSMALCSKPSAPALSKKRPPELPVDVVVGKKVHPCPVADEESCLDHQPEKEKGNDAAVLQCGEKVDQGQQKSTTSAAAIEGNKVQKSTRRRPVRIEIPSKVLSAEADLFGAGPPDRMRGGVGEEVEVEVEGGDYCVASRKGRRHSTMEDGHSVIANIHGDSKQAFFGVFDGHSGRAAVDFVSVKLGRNILAALDEAPQHGNHTEAAIKAGYLITDKEFLSQGVGGGTCAATVLIKDGELHVANAGDCRVVLSDKGVATALTDDHRADRSDERSRIENYGGLVMLKHGVWRVQDTLAVTRAIGDLNMKEWIIPEPSTTKLRLTPLSEFLILASDGLWDKVTNQEAVDVVSKHAKSLDSCKELIEMSCSRGSRDDITVMVIQLHKFVV